MSAKDNIGKYLALILRHKPEAIGIQLDEHGWACVDELIVGIARNQKFNMEMLEEIVRTDSKQRYSFNEDKTKIRANQGHSIHVDVELKETLPPDILWHGTGEKYVQSIEQTGLIPKSRLYVHLSADPDTAKTVGSRHGKPVVYQVDAKAMAEDGYPFYISANGVWLTKEVPVKYLKKYILTDKAFSQQQKAILDFLETSYTGAKAYGDEETMLRISRAILAFQADVYQDIFLPEVIENIFKTEKNREECK